MKIKAFVTIVAPDAETGEAIEIKPGGIADVRDDKAEYLIDEGYAEKAKRKDEVSGTQSATAAKKSGDRKGATQTTRGGARPERSTRRSRKELLGDKGENPDREKGENGKGFEEDSNAE